MKLLLDLDIICYRCGFAAQHKQYYYDAVLYQKKQDLYDAIGGRKEFDETKCEEEIIIEPLEFALNNVKTTLGAILTRMDTDDYTGYLSGGGNWRYDFATIREYKGNRDPDHKPHWYKEIREYLTKYWKAEVIEGGGS